MTRTEIEQLVASRLNRNDILSDGTSTFWFQIAHRDAQRLFNKFPATEETAFINLLDGVNSYDVFSDYREPIAAYLWDPIDSKVLQFYNKVNIVTVRERRFATDPTIDPLVIIDDFDSYLYAVHDGKFELWPDVDSSLVGKQFGMDYYKWMPAPDIGGEDWFTIHAFDYLFYRMLVESVTHFGLSSELGRVWQTGLTTAGAGFVNQQISTQISGPLRIRG